MATKLVIVESPTKAHKIGDYLGKGYTVMASVGHIRDLAQPSQVPAADKAKFGKFGVDVNDGFKPYYIVDGDKKRTVSELKSALKNADELYLATDEDREGEAIAWHLVQTLKPEVPVKRMVFHEITKNAINASLNNTRDVDGNMVDAQETRRILDRLYGYELSPVLWRKVGPGLAAGPLHRGHAGQDAGSQGDRSPVHLREHYLHNHGSRLRIRAWPCADPQLARLLRDQVARDELPQAGRLPVHRRDGKRP